MFTVLRGTDISMFMGMQFLKTDICVQIMLMEGIALKLKAT